MEKRFALPCFCTLASTPKEGFLGGTVVKNPSAVQETQEMWVQSLGREDPLEEEMATQFQYSCRENPTDRGGWWGYSPQGHLESDTTEHARTLVEHLLSTRPQ